jgi:hypothetical protein
MKWLDTDEKGTKDSFEIDDVHINNMTIINDYEETNMPVIYADITIDKNYMDKIIKSAKTAHIFMYIYKMSEKNDTGVKLKQLTSYTGKMSYFIDQDINYNKELDYKNTDEPNKKEVLQTFTIGLMFSECIETNKQTANTTLVNTTRMNAVGYYLQQYPYLIDPFTYNDSIEQLIVPPQESLSKTISYLNDIKVFYDTPYRFYIDPGCVYLMNSSGEGTPKEGDLYDIVLVDIIPIDEGPGITDGITEDSAKGCYYLDIHVKDSYYTVDTDTQKMYNEIQSIIDPGIKNTIRFLDTVNQAIQEINKAKDKLTGIVKQATKQVKPITSALTDYKGKLVESVNAIKYQVDHPAGIDFVDTDSAAASVLNPYFVPTATTVPKNIDNSIEKIKLMKTLYIPSENGPDQKLISDAQCDDWISKLTDYKGKIRSNNSIVSLLPKEYQETASQLIGVMHGSTSITSMINSISPINLSDNLSAILDDTLNLKSGIASHSNSVNKGLIPKINNAYEISNYSEASAIIMEKASGIYSSYLTAMGMQGTPVEDNPFPEWISSTRTSKVSIEKSAKSMADVLADYKSANLSVSNLIANIEPQIKAMSTFKTDIKSTITGTWDSLVNIGKTAKKSLDNIIESAKNIQNDIKSLDFSINSIQDLQKDINMVKDISKIGMLGLSNFNVDLNLTKDENGDVAGTGTKIVRLSNDNANMVKNLKADIENHANMLSITKTDVDTTILTPNKKYIVNNYDAHSQNNGTFLLTKKIDYFIRSGDVFTISTRLDLAKIAEETKNGKKFSYQNEINILMNHSSRILKAYNSNPLGVSSRSLGEIVNSAQTIQDSYTRLKNHNKE